VFQREGGQQRAGPRYVGNFVNVGKKKTKKRIEETTGAADMHIIRPWQSILASYVPAHFLMCPWTKILGRLVGPPPAELARVSGLGEGV
jgi:hypothetical protein